MLRIFVLTIVAMVLLTAAEPPVGVDVSKPVEVPDPIGLGERLALIDWLQEHKITVANPNDLPALRLAYLKAAKPALFADPEAAQKDAIAVELWQRHAVNADRKQTLATLKAMLADLDQSKAEAETAERQRQLALSGSGPRSPTVNSPLTAATPVATVPPAGSTQPGTSSRPAAPATSATPAPAAAGEVIGAPSMNFDPRTAGRIDRKPVAGPQVVIWERKTYNITACRKTAPGTYVLTFGEGTLLLERIDKKRWEVKFTANDASQIGRYLYADDGGD